LQWRWRVPVKKKSTKGLSLPKAKSKVSDRFWDYTILICGAKKIGKTSLFSHAERSFYMMCEPGGKGLAIHQRPCTTWKRFVAYVDLLEADKAFSPIIVDTVDLAYEACLKHVCWEMGIDHPTDAGYGKGWNAVKQEFRTQLTRLGLLKKGSVFISHSAEREVETRSGKSYSKLVPSMSGQAREMMESMIDIWIMYDYVGDERYMQILGDDHVSAGHRLESRFRYTDGTRIKFIHAGDSSQEAWDNLQAAFSNELERPEEEPVKLEPKTEKPVPFDKKKKRR